MKVWSGRHKRQVKIHRVHLNSREAPVWERHENGNVKAEKLHFSSDKKGPRVKQASMDGPLFLMSMGGQENTSWESTEQTCL